MGLPVLNSCKKQGPAGVRVRARQCMLLQLSPPGMGQQHEVGCKTCVIESRVHQPCHAVCDMHHDAAASCMGYIPFRSHPCSGSVTVPLLLCTGDTNTGIACGYACSTHPQLPARLPRLALWVWEWAAHSPQEAKRTAQATAVPNAPVHDIAKREANDLALVIKLQAGGLRGQLDQLASRPRQCEGHASFEGTIVVANRPARVPPVACGCQDDKRHETVLLHP